MCHFVTKICDKFMTNKKGSAAGWKLRGGGGSQKTLPVTTHQVKKEKILITTTTTILYYLVSDIWQKMQKTSTVSPHKT